jgi:hypothetical protein
MLMPAAVLIVIVLGSIAVDFAIVFLGEREAASLAAAAANDAATAVAEEHFRESGAFRLDEDRARRAAEATLDASSSVIDDLDLVIDVITVAGEPAVTVTVSGTVAYVFAPALPGGPDRARVEATATAVAREG